MATSTTNQAACTANLRIDGSLKSPVIYSLLRINLPAITGTITAATLNVNVQSVYASPVVYVRCHKSGTDWNDAGDLVNDVDESNLIKDVAEELAAKSTTDSDEFAASTTGWKSLDILGSAGSGGTGILRAYELEESDVTILLSYDSRTDFSLTIPWALGTYLPFGYDYSNGTGSDDRVDLYARSNSSNYPRIEITYTEAAPSGSATRSVLVSPILNSSIVR